MADLKLQRAASMEQRIQLINKVESFQPGPVLYWMDRDCRVADNWAFVVSQHKALQKKEPLFVVFNLVPNYLGGLYRHHYFKLKGLEEVAAHLKKLNIHFVITHGDTVDDIVDCVKKWGISEVVTDFNPLKINQKWKKQVGKKIDVPLWEVDAHNIVPCWVASEKQEFAARTIRPKIHKLLPTFLIEFSKIYTHPYRYSKKVPAIKWKSLYALAPKETKPNACDWIVPGAKAAHKELKKFIEKRFSGYAENRNDPSRDPQAVSQLSPYMHYGQMSAQRIALAVQKSGAPQEDKEAFLEELIVRRELSDNYCYYNSKYDSVAGFADWAQQTLREHANDTREYIYTKKQFEEATTHDDLWNAAQMEMVLTGKMHGYMRMYWAKKILEWTKSPADAFRIAIYLNDRYELDGRDPNGYVGVAWSIGGVHDRPWFERKIYGKVRYMNKNGCKRKFDVEKYILYVNKLKKTVDRG